MAEVGESKQHRDYRETKDQGQSQKGENEKGNHKTSKETKEKGVKGKFELVDGSFRAGAVADGAPGGVSGVITSALKVLRKVEAPETP